MKTSKIILSYVVWGIFLGLLLIGGYIVFGVIVHQNDFSEGYQAVIRALSFINWFILGLIAIVEIVSLFFDRDAMTSTAVLAIAILAAFSVSNDAVRIYFNGLPEAWISEIFASLFYFFTAVAMMSVFQFIIQNFHLKVSRREYLISLAGLIACSVSCWPLMRIGLDFIPFIGQIFFLIYVSIKLLSHVRFSRKPDYPTVAVFIIAALLLDVGLSYVIAAANNKAFSTYGLPSIFGLVISLLFLSVYIHFVYRTTRKAYKTEQVENTLKTLQNSVLRNQIAPHFMFNSLQAVKTNYRISQDRGDMAIDLLSKHLRNYVESGDKYTTPFVKELDAVMTFVELANIRTDHPFNIIYNIDAEDFEVPTLSIETFIENAILYSGVNEKTDGYIEISSFEEGDSIMVRISDNGRGFDTNSIREGAVGIKNAFERFRLSLNAECHIESAVGQGTTITVAIPKGGTLNESHRS